MNVTVSQQLGNVNEGIMHLSNAVVSCQQPAELLTIFRQTIPPDHFELLVHAIPGAKMVFQIYLIISTYFSVSKLLCKT